MNKTIYSNANTQFLPSTLRHPCRFAQMPHVERKRRWLGRGLQLAALLPFCLGLPSHSEPAPSHPEATPQRETGAYGRLGAGVAWPQTDGFRDGNCTSTQPAALFGCGAGNDGRRLGATGGFNPALAVDGALGYRFNRWIRAEALVSWLPDLEFQGQSNFRGAAGSNQPVNGAVSSVAGFGVAYVDLPRVGEVRPFLGAGMLPIKGVTRGINYGSDKVRFINMVRVGKRVRMRQKLLSAEPKAGGMQLKNECTIEIEGQERPACVAETISVVYG
jgi:opacity protein-like surface antigen